MSKHKSIWNKLTKKELVHIIERGNPDAALEDFKKLRKSQIKIGIEHHNEACWDCRFIAKKLEIE